MLKDIIQISFVGMEPTEALKKYVIEKILKKGKLFEEATSIEVFLKENKYSRGIDQDFRVDINVKLPKSPVRVEQRGPDMYANIDMATDTLFRRLKRYYDKRTYWEGKESWKVLEAEAQLKELEEESDIEDYSDYVPKISVRKVINDMTPLEEGEAIERMELLGYDQLLFRSKVTGKISMIYRRKDGDYGLVEPYES
ncbi:MAG: ribosome-associated translation inhibitor RaiA [Candidatus Dojkabacteria bacterium]|nr:ribosome-associated translation inhibitor RaiA [Candidatus Dojkabacteria bacterium]